jgi:light-regulated signal transduction histidine kinase (bacteriophytochrome)
VTEEELQTDANNEELQTQADAVKQKRDEEISACFERARKNLNGLLRSKKQVIRDLAHELERLGRPIDHIAAEIVHELRECEELSKSLIYSYLDEKYKDPSHASRRKGKPRILFQKLEQNRLPKRIRCG